MPFNFKDNQQDALYQQIEKDFNAIQRKQATTQEEREQQLRNLSEISYSASFDPILQQKLDQRVAQEYQKSYAGHAQPDATGKIIPQATSPRITGRTINDKAVFNPKASPNTHTSIKSSLEAAQQYKEPERNPLSDLTNKKLQEQLTRVNYSRHTYAENDPILEDIDEKHEILSAEIESRKAKENLARTLTQALLPEDSQYFINVLNTKKSINKDVSALARRNDQTAIDSDISLKTYISKKSPSEATQQYQNTERNHLSNLTDKKSQEQWARVNHARHTYAENDPILEDIDEEYENLSAEVESRKAQKNLIFTLLQMYLPHRARLIKMH